MERENIYSPGSQLVINELPELSMEEALAQKKAKTPETKTKEEEIASEICRKYQKGDKFDFLLEKRGSRFSIMLEGVRVGSFILKGDDKTKTVGMIMLNEELRGKGFGKQLYIRLNEYFRNKDGSVLVSDSMRLSEDADRLWQSLVKDGLAEVTDIETADGHKVYKFKS